MTHFVGFAHRKWCMHVHTISETYANTYTICIILLGGVLALWSKVTNETSSRCWILLQASFCFISIPIGFKGKRLIKVPLKQQIREAPTVLLSSRTNYASRFSSDSLARWWVLYSDFHRIHFCDVRSLNLWPRWVTSGLGNSGQLDRKWPGTLGISPAIGDQV